MSGQNEHLRVGLICTLGFKVDLKKMGQSINHRISQKSRYYIDRMLICLNKRSLLHVLQTTSPSLPIGKKILTNMKYPIR